MVSHAITLHAFWKQQLPPDFGYPNCGPKRLRQFRSDQVVSELRSLADQSIFDSQEVKKGVRINSSDHGSYQRKRISIRLQNLDSQSKRRLFASQTWSLTKNQSHDLPQGCLQRSTQAPLILRVLIAQVRTNALWLQTEKAETLPRELENELENELEIELEILTNHRMLS